MCRNIKTLFNFEPPVTDEEIRAASLQFVRKLSGFTRPSKANEPAFELAVDRTAEVARVLLGSLVTTASPRDRDAEAARARKRAAVRFGVQAGAIACLVALPVLAGALPALADAAADAAAHSKAFEKAVNARDAKAILALYAADAYVVWPGQGDEAHGKAAIEKLVADFLKGLPADTKLTLESQTALPLGGGEIATVGHWRQTFTDPDGKKGSVAIRTTEIIEKAKGKTLYVVDHASIGLGPEPPAAAQEPARGQE